ncbi:hypothetical protein SUGI_0812280 [Cryptomeria japonica]|nr:hypothetical protein SUGI_0812280 [Cryptomeria japonica]
MNKRKWSSLFNIEENEDLLLEEEIRKIDSLVQTKNDESYGFYANTILNVAKNEFAIETCLCEGIEKMENYVETDDGKDVVGVTEVTQGIHIEEDKVDNYDFPKFDSTTLLELDYVQRGRREEEWRREET